MSSVGSRGCLLIAIACGAAFWVACVGDDPTPSPPPRGATDGGGASDARSGGASDARSGGACETLTSTDQFFDCPLANGGKETCSKATKACCPGAGCVDRTAGCPGSENKYTCMASPSCDSEAKVCCISGAFDPTPACGLASVIVPAAGAAAQCTDPPLCNGALIQLCTTGNDCGIGTCVPTAIVANGISFIVNACK